MRFPRVRFTVNRMAISVALAGSSLGYPASGILISVLVGSALRTTSGTVLGPHRGPDEVLKKNGSGE
jgi:hypothetical protein